MQRCLELAAKGAGNVAPNPLVGGVLVHGDRIIGEGWHQRYGEAHAEVNCINSVSEENKKLITSSTLYVSLEPCAHFGKTPPCADLIIKHKIPRVVIGCRDPFIEVNGKGIEKLQAAGVEVENGILEEECKVLNKRFFTFHTKQRPYIILKWAETADGKIAASQNSSARETLGSGHFKPEVEQRLFISNEYSNRLVHQWRSEEAAILIGTNTARLDNPELTTRLWPGKSPVRLVLDMNLRLPNSLKIFNGEVSTIIFNSVKQEEKENLLYYKLQKDNSVVSQLMNALYQLKIQSVLVEGGTKVLQSFIDEGLWDEARLIKNEDLIINSGLAAPTLSKAEKVSEQKIHSDKIEVYNPKNSRPATNE
ncbi:riboflavin biosynthesis protein RibD [Chitinophagaceae bacterium IBVUCB2]|nr:riboflavin biosynthesis protein RibD [Chitinophagaceae bacterium IBVUCB2]